MEIIRSFPAAIIYIFLIGAFLQPLIRNRRASLMLTALITAVAAGMSIMTVLSVHSGGRYFYDVAKWEAPWGIELSIGYIEAFSISVICGVGALIAVYAMGMIEKELPVRNVALYNTLFLALMGAMTGIVATGDLFNMYVFIEIASITACGIISVRDDGKSVEATVKYLVYSALASGCILLAIALLYGITGNLNIRYMHYHLTEGIHLYPRIILLAACLFIVGFGVKSALFPLHIWLPDAHSSAATSSSAILSGLVLKAYAVGMIKVLLGVFGMMLLNLFPLSAIFLCLGSAAVLIGSVLAITQTKIKRMLAYSSVVQMGYIYLGLSLFNETAYIGALYHILNHALTKTLLFLSAGNIIYYMGKDRIAQFKGIGHRMPVTMGAFAIGAFSMIGVPLTSGFSTKWYIGYGAISSGSTWVLIVLIVSSLLNAAYYLPVVVSAFFRKPDTEEQNQNKVRLPWYTSLPMVIIAWLIIILGIYPDPVINFIGNAAKIF